MLAASRALEGTERNTHAVEARCSGGRQGEPWEWLGWRCFVEFGVFVVEGPGRGPVQDVVHFFRRGVDVERWEDENREGLSIYVALWEELGRLVKESGALQDAVEGYRMVLV